MHKCVLCGADTILLINGIPTCVECDGKDAETQPPQLEAGGPVTVKAGCDPRSQLFSDFLICVLRESIVRRLSRRWLNIAGLPG
jgi:hypothetical protein